MRIDYLNRFEELVKNYQRDIINFQYRLVGNRFEAEDLAQETFIKAYKKLDTLKEEGKAKSWLYSIARNVAVDFFRKNKNRPVILDATILENYSRATAVDFRHEVLTNELARELKGSVTQMHSDDRLVIRLLYYEGFSYKEIGHMLNINENTLKSRLFRARKALYELIQANGGIVPQLA